MASTGLRVGAGLLGVGALGLVGNIVFGCVQRSGYCSAWSLAGFVGVLLILLGFFVLAVSYRRLRPSVPTWAQELNARSLEEPGTSTSGEPRERA